MKVWLKRRSLKFRLALWYTAVASVILLGLFPFVHVFVERQLRSELDKQLEIDWALVKAHLEWDNGNKVIWRKGSPATPESPGYAGTWFDVWLDGAMLLNHWPTHGVEITQPPKRSTHRLHTIDLIKDRPTRTLEKQALLEGREVVLRVFRDETSLQATLRAIGFGFALSVPLAAILAALGGYFTAARALDPIKAVASQARKISSDSLSQRLPNPNPHDELGEMITVFNETLGRLDDSFKALKRFTADASHELRTPLTALRTVGEVGLRERGDVRALSETIGSMLEEAQRLEDLVDFMLQLARLENDQPLVSQAELDVDHVLSTVLENLLPIAEQKQQRITSMVQPGLRSSGDERLLRVALMNILHNALRYSPEQSTITLKAARRQDEIVIAVADQGPGIDADEQEKIFERFYRIDKARSRTVGSAGLGLAIAKLSIERLGGSVELDSERGKGSEFRLILPANVQ